MSRAVEAEVARLLSSQADKRTDDRRQRLVRHGHLPEREIMTGIGRGSALEQTIEAKCCAEMEITTLIGSCAAFCTTASYFPQLKKCWETGSAGDLSLKMFSILGIGVALWTFYGVLKKDFVIILANAVSLCLLLGILYFKLRERRTA